MPALSHSRRHQSARTYIRIWLSSLMGIISIFAGVGLSHAATLSSSSLSLSDPRPSIGSVSYTFAGSVPVASAIKCVKWQFSDTSTGSNVPTGLTTTGATLNNAGTNYVPTPTSWALNKATNGTLLLTNATGETPTTGAHKIQFDGVANGSTADTKYWLRVTTYNNTDCATSPVDNAATLFIYTNGSTLSLTVDDTLSFTVNSVAVGQACDGTTSTAASTATTIPFGTVSAASNAVVCQDLTAASNATSGYTVYARYTSKPTNALGQTISDASGSNTVPASFSAPGTEAYGYTTNDAKLGTGIANRFTSPTQGWAAMTTANAEVGYESTPVTSTTYRIGHQAGVSLVTKPGTYTTTIIYTCTPIY